MRNPFPSDGEFRIVLVESKAIPLSSLEQGTGAAYGAKKRSIKLVPSKTDHGQRKSEASSSMKEPREEPKPRPALLQQLEEGGFRFRWELIMVRHCGCVRVFACNCLYELVYVRACVLASVHASVYGVCAHV